MEIKTGIDGKEYKVSEGTWYHIDTPDEIIDVMDRARYSGKRLRFHWGDNATGLDWGKQYDVMGTIGRSTGHIKIPLLIHNKRSTGGTAILSDCCVKITETTKPHRILYQHQNYHIKEGN